MKANYLPIQKVFDKHTVFEIPYYQRSYVWCEDNWARFLEDMEDVSKSERQYFIGSLILKQKPTETGSKYGNIREVIDGQQRLTTITIFFKVLSLLKENKRIFETFMIDLSDESDEQEISIHHNHIDKENFERIVNLQSIEDLHTYDEKKKDITKSKLVFLYDYFRKNIVLDKLSSDRIKRNVHFVTIDLDSNENEQQIFDTINSLGVKLTTSELLKNFLFDQKSEVLYNKYWKPVFEADEETKNYWDQKVYSGTKQYHLVDLFLYAYLIIQFRGGDYTVKTEDKLYYEKYLNLFLSYKDFLEKYMNKEKETLMKGIYDAAVIFKSYFNPQCKEETITSESGLERINLMMFGLDFAVMLPYVLFVLLKAEKEEQSKIYKYLEAYMMRRTIARLETRGYNALFSDGLITNKVITIDALKAYVDKRNEKDVAYRAALPTEILTAVNEKVYVNRQALGFLYMLESRLRQDKMAATKLLGLKNYSLEHLLPKKWKETWEKPTDPEVEKATNDALYTLGNLAIIPGALNSSISNAPWQIKLHGNSKKDGLLKNATGLITLDEYLKKENWNLDSIRERAYKLYEQILQVWSEEWDKDYVQECQKILKQYIPISEENN